MTYSDAHDHADAQPHGQAVAILGADALLAAEPATPVQLAHACLNAGFHSVVPASWGDELIASAVLREVQAHHDAPAVQCSCPLVARRLLAAGSDLSPFLISLVSPPIATARYLRAVTDGRLRITYVGRCPGAADDDIDARMTPEELLASFDDRGIALRDQPLAFDSVLPPDRRRYRSEPGGVPTPQFLWAEAGERSIARVESADLSLDLGQLLLSGRDVLIDVAPAVGCYCCGANPRRSDVAPSDARLRVAALEPPRAAGPVLQDDIAVDLHPAAPWPRPTADVAVPHGVPALAVASTPSATVSESFAQPEITPAMGHDSGVSGMQRRSPGQGMRAVMATTPTARDVEGRHLPRAYVAHRRPSPRGMRALTAEDIDPRNAAPVKADAAPSPPDPNAAPSVQAPSPTLSAGAHQWHAPEPHRAMPPARAAGLDLHTTIALLVALAAVVLFSAMIGVVVGHWMTR